MNNKPNAVIAFIKKYKICIFIGICIVLAPSLFSLSYSEWLHCNIYLRPLYTLFSFSSIGSYWVHVVSVILVLIVVIIVLIYLVLPDNNQKKKANWVSWIILLLAATIMSCMGYLFIRSTIIDAIAVYNNRYEILDTDITHIKKSVNRGKRGSHSNTYRIIYIEREQLPDKDIYTEEKHIDLDAYQYRELKKIKEEYESKQIPLYKVKLKAYYLPISRNVVKYECHVEE